MKTRHLFAFTLGLAPWLAFLLVQPVSAAPEQDAIAKLYAELDHAILPASGHSTAVIKVGLLPARFRTQQERPPINLAIVLDRSGSMNGTKLEMAKRAAARAFDALRPDDSVSIISYSNTVQTLLPLTPVRYVHEPQRYIEQIQAGGGTAIYAGVTQAADELRDHSEDRYAITRILLLSDGLANQGPSSTRDFELLGQSLSHKGITVSTIGLGLDYNEDLMAGLASSSQGNIYFVETANDLPRIFDTELGDASSLVAREATIDIECLTGFEPIRIIGREGRIDGNRVTIEISNLYAGREKFVLLEVRNPGGKTNSKQTIAKIETRIQGLQSDEPITLRERAEATFSNERAEQEASVNLEVQRVVVSNRIALVQDEAVALADQGKLDDATLVMKDLQSWITARNATWNDADIAHSNSELNQVTVELEERGLDKRNRKAMKTSSYQTRSQQSYQSN